VTFGILEFALTFDMVAQCLFGRWMAELIWRTRWDTRRQVRGAIFQYINGIYIPRRCHSSLSGKSPLVVERRVA
jgi:hypothetical protein